MDGRQRTVNPGLDSLETVHHGRVESRSPFHPEPRRDEDEVQETQVSFLIPWYLVGLRDARQARVDVLFFATDDSHCRYPESTDMPNMTPSRRPTVDLIFNNNDGRRQLKHLPYRA